MNLEIINDFNHKINEYGFIFFKYRDVEGKAKWNCICSSIQWIRLCANVINKIDFDIMDIDVKCMELYKYISCIDIIIESLQQLHRIFYRDNNLKTFPDSNNIFKNKISKMSDNKYFKMIRAAYGAHPINLDEPDNPGDKELKRFASNPFDNKHAAWKDNHDFDVKLYTNLTNGEDINFPIWLEELNEYANNRYNYLGVFCNKIDELYKLYIDEYKSKQIETSTNIQRQIEILISESKVRLNNDYYNSSLKFLKTTFSLTCVSKKNNKLLDKYKSDLIQVVNEIRDNLQNMNLIELKTNRYLEPYLENLKLPKMVNYALEKLSNAYNGNSKLFYQQPIEEFLKNLIDFENISLEERYILTHAGLSYLVNKNKKT